MDHDDAEAGLVGHRSSGHSSRRFGVPVGFDTDVNAAALAEGRWGAARGLASFVYLTLGTGIGGGAVVDGRMLHGLGHPEMGHIAGPAPSRRRFAGVCPFHGDCLEGMASGPAVAARFGRRAEQLEGAEQAAAAELVGFYVGAGIRSIIYTLAPERIVIGGGLSALPGVVAATRAELRRSLAATRACRSTPNRTSSRLPRSVARPDPSGRSILAERRSERRR